MFGSVLHLNTYSGIMLIKIVAMWLELNQCTTWIINYGCFGLNTYIDADVTIASKVYSMFMSSRISSLNLQRRALLTVFTVSSTVKMQCFAWNKLSRTRFWLYPVSSCKYLYICQTFPVTFVYKRSIIIILCLLQHRL